MRKVKTSSGDLSYVNPYNRVNRGQEVTTSKIVRKNDKVVSVTIYKKVL